MTANTCVDVQWGASDVHIVISLVDELVSDGVDCVPEILGVGGTPVSPGSQRFNLGAQGLNLHSLLLVRAGERDHIIDHIGDKGRVLLNILLDCSNILEHFSDVSRVLLNILLTVINISGQQELG